MAGKLHAVPANVFPFEAVKNFPAGAGVRQFITRDPNQPFCLFLCSNFAHPPWRQGDMTKVDPQRITLPPTFHDNLITRQTYVAYLAEVAALDKEVNEILQMLRETGQADSTLVMFSSEQGWDFAFGKWTNWDIGVHTALIARWPGRIRPGTVTDALVQMADVTPTFIDAAGGDLVSCKLDGTSFVPVLTGRARTHREFVYGLHNNVPEGRPYPIRSIRDGEFHYILNLKPEESYHEKHLMTDALAAQYDLQWWRAMSDAAERGDAVAKKLQQRLHHRPAEELYRVDTDPYELFNLANDPACAKAKARLRSELERWISSQGDPGVDMDKEAVYSLHKPLRQPGKARPLKTIQAGANLAQPGDTVLVHSGIYREEVVPPRGGTSTDKPMIYKAAGNSVSIRGSEQINTWQDQGGGVWMVELDTAFFKGYNPFARRVWGAWLGKRNDYRLGDVYCNGEALRQQLALEDMRAKPNTWLVDLKYGYVNRDDLPEDRQYHRNKMNIWANFGDVNPNIAMTEINARKACIFPEKAYLKYIVIDGFDIRHAAPQWGDIYWTEYGAVGMKYGYGWTIQNCTIAYSRNIGISMGVTDEVHFPRPNEGDLGEGGSNIPPMDKIGHHLIRNNVIRRCGQCGIYG